MFAFSFNENMDDTSKVLYCVVLFLAMYAFAVSYSLVRRTARITVLAQEWMKADKQITALNKTIATITMERIHVSELADGRKKEIDEMNKIVKELKDENENLSREVYGKR